MSPPPRPLPSSPDGLSDVGEWLKASWRLYLDRGFLLLGVLVLVFFLFLFPLLLLVGFTALAAYLLPSEFRIPVWVLGGSAALFVPAWLGAWGHLVYVALALDRSLEFGDAWRDTRGLIGAYWWVMGLVFFLVLGGVFLFLLPGILFSVWFSFALFVLVGGGARGMNALAASRDLFRGRFWPVFGRLLLLGLLNGAVSWVPFVGGIASLALAPLFLLAQVLLYEELKTLPAPVPSPPQARRLWLAAAAAGWLGPCTLIGAHWDRLGPLLKDAVREAREAAAEKGD